jgi:poly-gamma-glutamate synthesis protein (capsule biosynthesis protein)
MDEYRSKRKPIYGVIALCGFLVFCGFLFFIRTEIQKSFYISIQGSLRFREVSDEVHKSLLKKIQKRIEDAETVRYIFVGDIMLSRGIDWKIRKMNDYTFPFLQIASTTREADVTFGNLEGPISLRGKNQGSEYSFRANPNVVKGLLFAGFDILSLANNHMWDWGGDALTDTIDILKQNNILTVGAGKNEAEANSPVFVMKGNQRIVFFAYTNLYPQSLYAKEESPGISAFDEEKIVRGIKEETIPEDVVIVSLHWGDEYKTQSNDFQKRLGRALIDAGVDLVIGHHPHVVEEVEQYKDGWIAYSLGNFVFDQNFSKETSKGLLLEVTTKSGRVEKLEQKEIRMNKDFQPTL